MLLIVIYWPLLSTGPERKRSDTRRGAWEKSFYDERCRALHETVTPEVLRDALKRARSMIAKDAWRVRRIIAGSPGLDQAQVED